MGLILFLFTFVTEELPKYLASILGNPLGYAIATSLFYLMIIALTLSFSISIYYRVFIRFGKNYKVILSALSHYSRPIAIIMIVSFATVAGVATYRSYSAPPQQVIFVTTVSVTGIVRTASPFTQPTRIQFTTIKEASGVSVTIGSGGAYTIALRSNETYAVTVQWASLLGISGTCNAGLLNIPPNADSAIIRNAVC